MAGLHIALIATAVLAWGGQISAANLPDYKVGDTVVNDVVAPGPLSVVNVEATKALWKKEAEEIPFVFQYNTNPATDAEKEFRAAVAKVRTDFLTVYNASAHRPQNPEDFPLPGFSKFLESYRESTGVPLLTIAVTEKWAKSEPDDVMLNPLVAQLRKAMTAFIRPDALPEELSIDDTACIVTDAGRNLRPVERIAQLNGTNVPVSRILSLTQAKLALEQQFNTDHALGKYMASFLRPNCLPDAGLTWSLRSVDGEPMLVADIYKAGDIIARRGEIVTSKTAPALQMLAAPPSKRTTPKAPQKTASRSAPPTTPATTSPATATPAEPTHAATTPVASPQVTTSHVAKTPAATKPTAVAPTATTPTATNPATTTPAAINPAATTATATNSAATPVATTPATTTAGGTAPSHLAITIVLPSGTWPYVAISLIALLAVLPLIRRMLRTSPAASSTAVPPADAPLRAASDTSTESGPHANIFAVWRNRALALLTFVKRIFTLAKAEWELTSRINSQDRQIPNLPLAAINPHEAMAHYGLGIMFANGLGVDQNWVEGYARLILSTASGENKLTKACRELEKKLSSEQITQGRERAQQLNKQMQSQTDAPLPPVN